MLCCDCLCRDGTTLHVSLRTNRIEKAFVKNYFLFCIGQLDFTIVLNLNFAAQMVAPLLIILHACLSLVPSLALPLLHMILSYSRRGAPSFNQLLGCNHEVGFEFLEIFLTAPDTFRLLMRIARTCLHCKKRLLG